jgi:hypothetical protein
MNRGRQNGKRHAKRKAKGGFVVTPTDRVVEHPPEWTGTTRVVLDNTVPGGVRLEHQPAGVKP